MLKETTTKSRLKTDIGRPHGEDGKLLYYVLLLGVRPSKENPVWLVEARISATMRATGRTELDALERLLGKISASGGEASFSRLRGWRSMWKPIPDGLRSLEVVEV